MREFKLKSDFIELNNLLKVTQACASGGMANTAISGGQVRVDGNVELRKRCKIRPGQTVEFKGIQIVVTREDT